MKFVFVFSMLFGAMAGWNYLLLSVDKNVHLSLITQFGNNVTISRKMTDQIEREKNVVFSEVTLQRLQNNYRNFVTFRYQVGCTTIISLFVASIFSVLSRLKLPGYAIIHAAVFTLTFGFVPVLLYENRMESCYRASDLMLSSNLILLLTLWMVITYKAFTLRKRSIGIPYRFATIIIGVFFVIGTVYVFAMMSVFDHFELG